MKKSLYRIGRNLLYPTNLLRLILAVGLILPIFATVQPVSANTPDEAGTDFETARELLDSANPANYLPPQAHLPFNNNQTTDPFSFLDSVVTSPFDMLPNNQVANSNPLNPASTNNALLGQFNELVDDLDESERIATANATDDGFTPLVDIWNWFRGERNEYDEPGTAETSAIVTVESGNAPGHPPFDDAISPRVDVTVPQPSPQPEPEPEPDIVYTSKDGRVTLTIPAVNFDTPPYIEYAPVSIDNLTDIDTNVPQVADSIFMFTVSANDVGSKEAVRFLKQRGATLDVTLDRTRVANFHIPTLRIYGYSPENNLWYMLPTTVDVAGLRLSATTTHFTLFSLAPGYEPEDPCAIATELLGPPGIPFTVVPPPPPPRPQEDLFGVSMEFDHYYGTEIFISGGDTGDSEESDPTILDDLLTHTYGKFTGPEGDWEKDFEEDTPLDTSDSDPERDVTDLFPEEPDPVPPPGIPPRYEPFPISLDLKYLDTSFDTKGSTEYWLIRKDFANPYTVQVYTFHDGEGGVNVYVWAQDNCAVGQIQLTYSNSVSGGGVTLMEYMGAAPDGGAFATDGWGWYRAQIQLPTTGVNTYQIQVDDMAEYATEPKPNSIIEIYTEQASNSAGFGELYFAGACSPKCGCDGVYGCTGDPINTAYGNFTITKQDSNLPGIGDTNIVIHRSYNSLASERYYAFVGDPRKPISPFGLGWTSPFNFNLEIREQLPLVGPGVKVNYPDGHSARYAGTSGILTPLTPGEANILETGGPGYILTDKLSRTEYRFDTDGRLVQIVDANLNTVTYTQGTFGPTNITNSAGRTINLTYNADGLITQITGPEGLNLQYGYTGLLLTSFTDERGETTLYAYDAQNHLIRVTSPKGHDSLQMTYLPDGRVESQTVGATESYTVTYDDVNYIRTITDANGNNETQYYDTEFRLIQLEDARGFSEHYTYNAEDLRASLTDKLGRIWNYEYDGNSNIVSTTGSLGWSHLRTYDGNNKLTSTTDSFGNTTSFAYDGNNNMIGITNAHGSTMSMTYYANGQLETIIDFNGNSITYEYDGTGNAIRTTNGAGETLNYTYDGLGRMISMTTAEGATYTFEYDEASDLLSKMSGPLGYEIIFEYDANGNMVERIDPNRNPTTYDYDTSENLVKVTDALGGETTFTYDAMNNMASMSDELGRVTTYSYDAIYNLLSINAPEGQTIGLTYDGAGNRTSLTNPRGDTISYEFDDLDRVVQITDPIGYTTTLVRDAMGNILSVTDGNGHTEVFTYDDLYRVSTETNAEGETTTYTYDANSNLLQVADAEGLISVKMTYNQVNRIATVMNGASETMAFTYDSLGTVIEMTNPRGIVTYWNRDALGRPVEMIMNYIPSSPPTTEINVTYQFEYDLNGNMLKMVDPDGFVSTFSFDALDRLETETDARGNIQSFEYDAVDNLLTRVDRQDNTTTFDYDDANRAIKVTDALGGITEMVYDPNSNLIEYIDPNVNSSTFTYDARDRLLTYTNPEGETLQREYDGVGNLIAKSDGNGYVTTIEYDDSDRPIVITDPLGGMRQWLYDEVGNIIRDIDENGNATNITYDAAYRPIQLVDAEGNTTILTYDANGNTIQWTDPNGNSTDMLYDALDRLTQATNAEGELTQYGYDARGNVTDITSPRGIVTHYDYDGLLNVTSVVFNYVDGGASGSALNVDHNFTYDPAENLIEYEDPLGNRTEFDYDVLNRLIEDKDALGVSETYLYDAVGNLRFVTNRRGHTTEYQYDGANRLTHMIDPLDGITKYDYDDNGTLIHFTDEKGNAINYDYDALYRLTSLTNRDGDVFRFEYDPVGNMTKLIDAKNQFATYDYDGINRPIRYTDRTNGVTETTYDGVGNITHITDANGFVAIFDYDDVYRLLTVTDPEGYTTQYEYDLDSNVTAVTDGNDHRTELAYDELDRIVALTNPEGETTQYAYNRGSSLTDITEADGIVIHYDYDALYRMTKVTQNYVMGAPPDVETNVVTQYAYDPTDNLIEIIDPNGHLTTFTYDELQRLTSETNPLGNMWTYDYDAVDNLIKRVDANGATTTYDYYPDLRLQSVQYKDGTSIAYTYDSNNNMETMVDSLGTTTLAYDASDRVIEATDALGRSLAYGYDPVGNLTSMTYPNGGTITYEYEDNRWLSRVTDTNGQATTYERDGVGNVIHAEHANGVVTDYTYDDADRLLSVVHSDVNGDLIAGTTYMLNEVGLRTSAEMSYGRPWPETVTETYTYDGMRRLIEVADDRGFIGTYEYDASGNRLRWATNDNQMTPEARDGFDITYTYNEANQLLTESVDDELTAYTYDLNGNRTNKLWSKTDYAYEYGTDYLYDAEDRLMSVENYRVNASLNPGHRRNREETVNQYDGFGRRLTKTYSEHDGQGRIDQTEYVFDGLDIVAEYPVWEEGEFVGRNNHRNEFYLNDSQNIVSQRRFPNGVAAQSHDYLYDGRKNVVSITDDTGRAWQHYRYDSYGQILPQLGNLPHPEYHDHNQFTFTGKEWDEEAGMYYFGARHYEAGTGVWTTQDPFRGILSIPQSLHRYGFVHENPINYYDPYGYWPDFIDDALDSAGDFVDDAADAVGDFAEDVVEVVEDVGEVIDEAADAAVQWAQENQDVIAKGIIIAGATVGAAALCAVPPGVGCVAGAGLIAAAASYGTQSVDNVWAASGGTTLFDSQYYNADTLFHEIDWNQVAVDGVVGMFGANLGSLGSLTRLCNGAVCRIGVDTALGFVEGAGSQMLTNILDSDDCTALFDNVVGSSMWEGAFAFGGSTGGELLDGFRGGGIDADDFSAPCPIGNSFTAETTVITEDGEVPISEIEVGDMVLAYDEELGTTGYYTVTAVWSHEGDALAHVTIDGETIEATPEHPFYTLEYGWLDAQDLWLGMHVQTADGEYGEITSLQMMIESEAVYNLTVSGVHTFFVGQGEWLVHNCGQDILPDEALVCRGGTCTADRFARGSGVTIGTNGVLDGVSVNSGTVDLSTLTQSIPNKQVGVTTVGDIRAAGGQVIPSGNLGNPFHSTLSGLTPQQAESLFRPTIQNPNR